jgi:polar amino acid transport system substrate-binding protein
MKLNFHTYLIPLFLWCFLLVPVQTLAEPVHLRLSTVDNFKPFIWDDGGGPRGIDYDIVREMCRRMDLNCQVEYHPWKRVLSRIEDGLSDGGFTGFRTPERQAYAHFPSHPLHFSTYNIFVETGREFDFDTVADLYGKTIGIRRGFKINPEFEQAMKEGRLIIKEVNTDAQNIRLLLAGRVDAVAANYHLMRLALSEMGLVCELSCLPTPITPPRPSYLMISKKWNIPNKTTLLKNIDITFKEMYEDGTVDKINSVYLD